MNRRRGLSLVETMVAAGMLSLLLTMTFAVFRSGAQIWLTSDTEAELLGRIHALAGKIGRRAERSLPSSLSIVDSDVDPNLHACAFLSASDAQDRLQFDPYTGQPVWTDALVYYFDRSNGKVFFRSYPLVGVSARARLRDYSQRFMPEAYDNPLNLDPRNPLSDWLTDGQVLATGIEEMRFDKVEEPMDLSSGDTIDRYYEQLSISLTVEKESYGSKAPIRLKAQSFYLMRN